jgi:hypothetical protein
VPTVLRMDGFRVVVFLPPREHPPAHVHVRNADGEAIITLDPVLVREAAGMSNADIVRAVRIAQKHRGELMREWRKHHG